MALGPFTGLICSSVFYVLVLFLYVLGIPHVRQTKVASSLVNFKVHRKILID